MEIDMSNINLNNFGEGKKLVQKLINSKQKNMPWSKEKQKELINNRKNSYTPKNRNEKNIYKK